MKFLDGVKHSCNAKLMSMRVTKLKYMDKEQEHWRHLFKDANGLELIQSITEHIYDAKHQSSDFQNAPAGATTGSLGVTCLVIDCIESPFRDDVISEIVVP